MRIFSSLGHKVLTSRSNKSILDKNLLWNRLQFCCCCCCCWIHLFSLGITRPATAFSTTTTPFALDLCRGSVATTTFSNAIMPRRSTRAASTLASSKLEATKGNDDSDELMDDEADPKPSRKSSQRKRPIRASATDEIPEEGSEEEEVAEDESSEPPAKKKVKKAAASKAKGTRKAPAKKKATKTKGSEAKTESDVEDAANDGNESSDSDGSAKKKKKKSPAKEKSKASKKAASEPQRITERDELPKLWDAEKARAAGSYTFKIASWNVAGLRAVVKKDPDVLSNLCKEHDLDMLCLQETKIQETHLDDPKLNLRNLLKDDGYDGYWSCSVAKKGYSGTAVFVKHRGAQKSKQSSIKGFFAPKSDGKKGKSNGTDEETHAKLPIALDTITPTEVTYDLGEEIDNEGRTVIVEFPFATITNVYVPNSGQKLERLDYRTKEWDKFFLEFMKNKRSSRGLPVMWLGDLNIAHKAFDIWNNGAKHLDKQAGVTPQERESFQSQLDSGFIDAFRQLHPTAKGHYSYWSNRAGNREPNKGLRLDYFVCSPEFFSEDSKVIARDSYFIPDQTGSDHCPAVIELEIKGE